MTYVVGEREWRETVAAAKKSDWSLELEWRLEELDTSFRGIGRFGVYLHRDLGEIRQKRKAAFEASDVHTKLGVTFEEWISKSNIEAKLGTKSKEQREEEQRRSEEMDAQLWDAMLKAQLGG